MAELSDDTLSDDDPLKRNEELEEGHPFRGLVFHWASDIGGWGNKALGDDDQAWADEYKLSIREGAPEYLGYARLTEADIAFLPSLPELTDLGISLTNLPKSTIDDVAKRCPKLINLSGWI